MSRADRSDGHRILLAGTGGQGVITAAKFLSDFFVERGHAVVSGQLHGMAQRGGAVQSSVLIDCGISPIMRLGGADIVLGCEPAETVRALPYMSARTAVFMNTTPVIPYVLSQQFVLEKSDGKYPDTNMLEDSIRAVTRRLIVLNATALADAAGSGKSVNVVMLGCLFGAGLLPYKEEEFLDSVMRNVPSHIAEPNNRAFQLGAEVGAKTRFEEEQVWR